MIGAIGIMGGIFTELFSGELHLQQVGKTIARSIHSHRDCTYSDVGWFWDGLNLHISLLTYTKAKHILSLKNKLS